jgi:hypothetical protein
MEELEGVSCEDYAPLHVRIGVVEELAKVALSRTDDLVKAARDDMRAQMLQIRGILNLVTANQKREERRHTLVLNRLKALELKVEYLNSAV